MRDYKLQNYSTNVSAEKSILDIERLLTRAGASKIAKDYAADGTVTAFIFAIPIRGRDVPFRMPCDVDRVYAALMKEYKKPQRDTSKRVKEQASRVAWRILLDWMESQIAMIRLGQVEPQQVFLPYAYDMRTGQTFYQKLQETNFKMLGSGNGEEQ